MNCYLLIDGEVLIKTLNDHKTIVRIRAPFIFGLGLEHDTYLQTQVESTFRVLPVEEAIKVIREKQLWESLFYFYRRIASFAYERLRSLNKPSSKQIVVAILHHLMSEPSDSRHTISIVQYVQENSSLSRSSIYKIISELKSCGDTSVRNGMLLAINKSAEEGDSG